MNANYTSPSVDGEDQDDYTMPDLSDPHVDEESKEDAKAFLLRNETDLLEGLLEAADYKKDKDSAVLIQIVRKGRVMLAFHIRPLDEKEYNDANRAHTIYKKSKGFGGVRVPMDTNTVKYRSQLIYNATVPEDRARIWDNKAAWEKFGIATGIDMVDILLKAGEKSDVVDKLDELSGYDSDEDIVKN